MDPCCVTVFNRQREIPFKLKRGSVQAVVEAVLASENQHAHFLNVSFFSDRLMRAYHKRFFQDGSSTDCMSFPIDIDNLEATPRALGDILICPKIALLQVDNNTRLFWEELTLYLIHGLLHLLGYEDTSPKKRAIMRSKEKKLIEKLKKNGSLLSGKFL